MAANRKLQSEMDRCMKKVAEGVEKFEETWQKVQNASNANQKEKYEEDLKKEIKKLQRLRDQIKTWIASNAVNDKSMLMEKRRLIEQQMERFRIVERETKTKAYSKEGLTSGSKLDPAERERVEVCNWLNSCLDLFNLEIDKLEAEIETLSTGKRKKNRSENADQIEEANTLLTKHRDHILKLETLLRMLDNDAVKISQIKDIKDDLEYYLENCREPDFEENEYMYDDIEGLEEMLEEISNNFRERPVGMSTGNSNDLEESGSNESNSISASSPTPSAASGSTSNANNHSNDANSGESLAGGSSNNKRRHKSSSEEAKGSTNSNKNSSSATAPKQHSSSSSSLTSSATTTAISSSSSTSSSDPSSTSTISSSAASSQQHLPSSSASSATNNSSNSSNSQANKPNNNGAVNNVINNNSSSAAAVTAAGKLSNPNNSSPSSGMIAANGTGSSNSSSAMQSPAVINSTTNATNFAAAVQQLNGHHAPSSTSLSDGLSNSVSSSAPSVAAAVSSNGAHPLPTTPAAQSVAGAAISNSQTANAGPAPGMRSLRSMAEEALPAGSAPSTAGTATPTSTSSAAQNLDVLSSMAGAPTGGPAGAINSQSGLFQGDGTTPNGPASANASTGSSNALVPRQRHDGSPHSGEAHIPPLLGVAPLGPVGLNEETRFQYTMLEAAFQHMPHPSDSERLRPYLPRNPCQTPTYYPQLPPPGSDSIEFFQRLSTETLFFIFYYMEGTKAQFLAAKALKKQSWRFHTKYMMWFQRHEEPKIINDEFEQGTYVYFDFEKWGQRKKEGFTFEYRFLEDRDLN